jgi:hypothetical protein
MTYGLLMFLALEPSFRGYIASGDPAENVPPVAMALLVIMVVMNLLVLTYVLGQGGRLVYKVLREDPEAVAWKRKGVACFQHMTRTFSCGCVSSGRAGPKPAREP